MLTGEDVYGPPTIVERRGTVTSTALLDFTVEVGTLLDQVSTAGSG